MKRTLSASKKRWMCADTLAYITYLNYPQLKAMTQVNVRCVPPQLSCKEEAQNLEICCSVFLTV